MKNRIISAAAVLTLALLGSVGLATTAGATPPTDLLCTDITDGSYSPKVDADAADPFYVTIPDGQTLTAYCVKAGTTPVIVTLTVPFVGPGQVQIDHPAKDSVSHYQLQLITTPPPPVDVCANIEGDQATVPDGLVQDGDDCVEPEPEPQECALLSAWGTEADDTPPTLTPDGYLFEGGSGDAVGYGVALSGNLQGLPTIDYVATGDLDVFYPRIVINSLADGGWAYDSLTVISEGPVNGSSIAASNKRGFITHTLDEWAALLPNNELVAFFFHLDSGASADKAVTLSSVTGGCFSANFAPAVPEPISGEDVVEQLNCETGEVDITTTPWTQDQVWDAESKSYQPGEKVYGEPVPSTRELTEDEYLECYGEHPDPLSGSDKSQECDGSILVETTVDWTQEYTAEKTGYVLQEKVYADPKVSRTFDEEECPPALALTGEADALVQTGYLAVTFLALIGSGVALLALRRPRQHSE
jgi:hypothetical protein